MRVSLPHHPVLRLLLFSGVAALSGCSDAFALSMPQMPTRNWPEPDMRQNGSWQRVISDTTIVGDLLVPEGVTWLIGPDVRVAGNVRTVGGTIAMRPGSSLEFLGADPDAYVGGGMTYGDAVKNDIGLWVGPQGTLDIQCTPKTAWNRTGVDPSWSASDEYWIAPTAVGDFRARPWSPGQPVPQVDPKVPAAEVINVTRDCSITGPGHIHVHSQKPQRVEFVTLRNMGISNAASEGPVLGRYALHLHMSGNGTKGTIIRGVACIDCPSKVFVPHTSHGVTMIDNVCVNSWAECLWWDFGHETHDLMVDRLGCLGARMPDAIAEWGQSNVDCVSLGAGRRMAIRNSFAAATMGGGGAVGFDWPEPTSAFDQDAPLVWTFDEGNVAHNNRGPGLRFWDNLQHPHIVSNYISYRNGGGSVENGAYFGGNEYYNLVSVEDGYIVGNDLSSYNAAFLQNQSNTVNSEGRIGQLVDCYLQALEGPAIQVGHRQIPSTHHWLVQDCTLIPGPGQPKLVIGNGVLETKPAFVRVVRSGVTPDDVAFVSHPGNEGSEVLIDHEDGRKWQIVYRNGVKEVRVR